METSPQMTVAASDEPHWANQISNSLICNYFYIFFLIFAIWATLALFGGVYIFASRSKMTFGMLLALIINILLFVLIQVLRIIVNLLNIKYLILVKLLHLMLYIWCVFHFLLY